MREYYDVLMDPDKNPLAKLPKAQRFQLMIYLSLLWTTIFTFGIGYWAIYGQLILLHILVALGIAFTSSTFLNVKSLTHRDVMKRKDGTAMYDDIWGGV